MGRVLAIDYGRKRTGLAVTDPSRIIASPLESVATHELEKYLTDYLGREEVDIVVVGYPVTLNNKPSEAVKYIDPFLNRLRKLFPDLKIRLMDERFTSGMAFQTMIDGGVKKEKRKDKGMIDRISAAIILRSFLDQKSD